MIDSATLRDKARTLRHVQRVKRLVRDHLGSAAPCLVSVRETMCAEPGREGPATHIRIVLLDF